MNKKGNIIGTILAIAIIIILIAMIYPAFKDEVEFTREHGMSKEEYNCKEFCEPEEYLYYGGSLFRQASCECS